MKRLHISINVSDLDNSIGFYSTLFGTAPTVVRDDYAKWMLDDPRVNFVIEKSSATVGFTHAGIQVEDPSELDELFARMQSAEAPYLAEGTTTCCYHKSDKSWTQDPDGVAWEAFYTHHETEARGAGPARVEARTEAEGTACCGGCCP